jgi:hypothetical protein
MIEIGNRRHVVKVYLPNRVFQVPNLKSEECEKLNLFGKYKEIKNSQCALEVFVENCAQTAQKGSLNSKSCIGSVEYSSSLSSNKQSRFQIDEKTRNDFFLQLSFDHSNLSKCCLVHKNRVLNEQNTTFYVFVYTGKPSMYEYAFEKHSLSHTINKNYSIRDKINEKLDR